MNALSIPELIGYVASAFTIVSLMMSEVLRLRLMNFVAVTIWTGYGILLQAPALIITNAVLMGINLFFLYRIYTTREFFNLVEVRKEAVYLREFLLAYDKEIRRFYPDFKYDDQANVFPFFALRNVTAAGLFIMEVREDNRLYLMLDFTIPGYRDFKIGRYVYGRDSDVLKSVREHGFDTVYSDMPDSPRQIKYLRRAGFTEDAESGGLRLDLAA